MIDTLLEILWNLFIIAGYFLLWYLMWRAFTTVIAYCCRGVTHVARKSGWDSFYRWYQRRW